MEIGSNLSIRSDLEFARNSLRLEADKARAEAEVARTVAEPQREAAVQEARDTVRNTALAVDVAQQKKDLLKIVTEQITGGDSASSVQVIGANETIVQSATDAALAQRREELISFYRDIEQRVPPETPAGPRLSILI